MDRVIVVDDDITQTTLVKTILEKYGYEVISYNDPKELLTNFTKGMADIVLSDIHMPSLGGLDLVKAIKVIDSRIPFIMFTTSSDIKTIIEHFKKGVSDYLLKPVIREDLVHRVHRVLQESRNEKAIHKIEIEKDLIDLEKSKLSNWRTLYANKDANQSKQMMLFFTRSINSGCGWVWLDILNDLPKKEDGSVELDSDLYQLITESASSQKKAFEYLNFVNNLPEIKLDNMEIVDFSESLNDFFASSIYPLYSKSSRDLTFNQNIENITGSLNIDLASVLDILWELCINSIKFSPEGSEIKIEIFKVSNSVANVNSLNRFENWLLIEVRNEPKEVSSNDNSESIIGIPYDYIELVYDLFYTMESYPIEHKDEKWANGTGLYVARNLAKQMNCWIECKNMMDYTKQMAKPFVQFKFLLPITS